MTTTCRVEGCSHGGKLRRGLCGMHYQRFRASSEYKPILTLSTLERLTARLVVSPNGCHEWTGGLNSGYGTISVNNYPRLAHRVAWELANGPIPDGLNVLHRCDNPPCCRISHLFLGTLAENNLDMSSKGRNHNQVKTHCPSGHPYSGWNCYTPPSGGRYCRKCITIRGRVYIQNKAARAAS